MSFPEHKKERLGKLIKKRNRKAWTEQSIQALLVKLEKLWDGKLKPEDLYSPGVTYQDLIRELGIHNEL